MFRVLPKQGFPKIRGTLLGVLIIRILLFAVLYQGPLFSETPILIYFTAKVYTGYMEPFLGKIRRQPIVKNRDIPKQPMQDAL